MFIYELEKILKERHAEMPEGSYTAKLFSDGLDRILRKVGEETGEVIIAAKNKDSEELCNEVSDLLYHLIVMLLNEGHSLSDVDAVLRSRHS